MISRRLQLLYLVMLTKRRGERVVELEDNKVIVTVFHTDCGLNRLKVYRG